MTKLKMTTKSVIESLPRTLNFRRARLATPKAVLRKLQTSTQIFMKESESFVTINDNGQRRRISKLEGIAKQLHNKALTGNISALRIYLAHYPQAREIAALSAAQQSKDLESYNDVEDLTDEELMRIIAAGQKKTEQES
jgi:Family of unknown function (DUF5681)